jgi:hypothetical protein
MARNLFIFGWNTPGAAHGAGESRCPKSGLPRYTDALDGV